MSPSPGRPRRASREMLQEAAFELFQLRGYHDTSVEQIARTAGFSRATFFNFFSSKAELFWLETDALIAALSEFLEERLKTPAPPPHDALRDALLEYAETLSSADIPWALQNFRLIEAADDLVASGAGRVLRLNEMFSRSLRRNAVGPGLEAQPDSGPGSARDRDSAILSARAAATTALLLTALLAWIDAGVGRGSLRAHLDPVLRVLAPAEQ